MFLSHIVQSVKSKWMQPLIIVLTVMLATAMLMASFAVKEVVADTVENQSRLLAGDTEISISISNNASVRWMLENEISVIEETVGDRGDVYGAYTLYANATEYGVQGDSTFVSVYSTDMYSLTRYNSIKILQGALPVSAKTKICISKSFADKTAFGVGDFINLNIYGVTPSQLCEIAAIAEDSGIFAQYDILTSTAVVARFASSLFGVALGDDVRIYNVMYVDLKDSADTAEVMGDLRETVTSRDVATVVNNESLQAVVNYQTALLLTITFAVGVLTAILIYTSFVLLLGGRLHTMALFKSVGAERRQLLGILVAECALYGVIGSLLGAVMLQGIAALFTYTLNIAGISVRVTFAMCAYAAVYGVGLSIISAILPIMRTLKMSLSDMLSGDMNIHTHGSPLVAAVCVALWGIVFGLEFVMPVNMAVMWGILGCILTFAVIITLLPQLSGGVCRLVEFIAARKDRQGKIYLAAVGLKRNNTVHNSNRLLAIAIAMVVFITITLNMGIKQLELSDEEFLCDIFMQGVVDSSGQLQTNIGGEAGVTAVYSAFYKKGCAIDEDNTVTVIAIERDNIDKVIDLDVIGIEDISGLAGYRTAIISSGTAACLGVKVGDDFAVTMDNTELQLTVAGIFNGMFTQVICGLEQLDLGYNTLCINADSAEVYDNLVQKYSTSGIFINTEDIFSDVTDYVNGYVRIFRVFSLIIFVMCVLGVINNLIISYRSRRKEFELMKCCGTSFGEQIQICTVENVIGTVCAAAVGVASSYVLLVIVQNMLKPLGVYFNIFA